MSTTVEHHLPDGITPLSVRGSGVPLVMVHGWTLDHRSFEFQAPLEAEARLISFDRRGFGQSTSPADIEREPDDIIALLDRLDIETAVLLGVSQGGRVALRTACEYPTRFRGLVLQGAPLDGFVAEESENDSLPLAMYQAWVREGNIEAMRAHWLAHVLMSAGLQNDAQRAFVRQSVSHYDGRDLLASPSAAKDWQVQARLPNLDMPVLAITGELDTRGRISTAEKICALARHGMDTRIPGAGHLCNVSHADDYNGILSRWLKAL